MKNAVRVLFALSALLLVCASPAVGAVRSAQIDDGLDTQGFPDNEVVSAHVDYDDSGTVTASVTYGVAPGDEAAAPVFLNGAPRCAGREEGGPPELQIVLYTWPAGGVVVGQPPLPPTSSAKLAGSDGSLSAPTQVSADGRTVSATFVDPTLGGRDYRCVVGKDSITARGRDYFSGYFSDFEPQEMTAEDARPVMDAELARRFGSKWTQGSGKWAVCPQIVFDPGKAKDGSDAYGECDFRFKDGAQWRHGSMLFKLVDDYLVAYGFRSFTFTKALKTCHLRDLKGYGISDRHLRADGFVSCGDNPASMVRDVHSLKPGHGRVAIHGTGSGAFPEANSFRCVVKARSGGRRSATCANQLGDRFVYSFTTRKRS
jgi:hypothetical protein